MNTLGTVLVALVIAIGLVGIVVPVLPGGLLVFLAIAVWAVVVHTATSWVVLGVAAALFVAGEVIKYVWPVRRMRQADVATRSLIIGGILGVIGFFVIPVLGLAIASLQAAAALGPFAVVTGGAAWGPMLQRFARMHALDAQLRGIHTVELTGAQIAQEAEQLAALCAYVVGDHLRAGAGVDSSVSCVDPNQTFPAPQHRHPSMRTGSGMSGLRPSTGAPSMSRTAAPRGSPPLRRMERPNRT